MDRYNLVSFTGIFVMMALAWVASADRRRMNCKVIGWGLAIQLFIALFIFVFPAGERVFHFCNEAVVKVLDSSTAGARFIFGRLALPPGRTGDIAAVAPRALLAATLACLMTACVAGTFFTEGSILLGF